MPVSGDVVNAYSGEKMVKSKTLGDWVMHTGTDLAASAKTPVKAVSAGTVSAVETDELWGCPVTIEHANGVISYYAKDVYKRQLSSSDTIPSWNPFSAYVNTTISLGAYFSTFS